MSLNTHSKNKKKKQSDNFAQTTSIQKQPDYSNDKNKILLPQQHSTAQVEYTTKGACRHTEADIQKGSYGKRHMKGQPGTAAGAHTSSITATDVYPAEEYRKLLSANQACRQASDFLVT